MKGNLSYYVHVLHKASQNVSRSSRAVTVKEMYNRKSVMHVQSCCLLFF